jgi:hypothetical protein
MFLSSIFSSSRHKRDSYQFFFACTAWLLPIMVVVLFFEVALWQSGEILPLRLVANRQAQLGSRTVIMRRYFDQGLYRLKYLSIQKQRPEVLILGTSRVMQIRREMFGTDRIDVYNAGGMIQHLRDLEEFADSLTKSDCPRAIIIGIEPWWFNQKWVETAEKEKSILSGRTKDDGLDGFSHGAIFQLFVRSLIISTGKKRKIREDVFSVWQRGLNTGSLFLGFTALDERAGFRPDGSMDYGHRAVPRNDWAFVDREEPPVVERIRNRKQGFESVTGLNSASVDRLRKSLSILKSKGATVICFAPPFSSEAMAAIDSISDLRSFWHDYLTVIPAIVDGEGGNFFDASRPEKVGMDDRCMIDGMHAMETFHLALLMKISIDPNLSNLLCLDRIDLKNRLNAPGTTLWFPEYS